MFRPSLDSNAMSSGSRPRRLLFLLFVENPRHSELITPHFTKSRAMEVMTTWAVREPRGHSVRVATSAPTSRSPRVTFTPAAEVRVDRSMVYNISERDDAIDSIAVAVRADFDDEENCGDENSPFAVETTE
mmetsp:Transcript_34742/g.73248  ORF Transcript_34742/g.73248 Transcript_34742/m.73248 type:complete len:131 (+) Transcript_34742:358-750(+)